MTRSGIPARGGRPQTAAERGLAPTWSGEKGEFVEGQTVRLSGKVGPRWVILGFRGSHAELYPTDPAPGEPGSSAPGGQRTVRADLLRKVRA